MDGFEARRQLFFTLTAPGADRLPDRAAIDAWNVHASRRWESFIRKLERRFPGMKLETARVFEVQKRGAVHVHVVVRGAYFIPHALLVRLALSSGFGRIVDIRRVNDARGVASYLGSYLAKSRAAFPKGSRVFGTSRGWRVGWRRPAAARAGRFMAAPPESMSWWEWAEEMIAQGYGDSGPPRVRPGDRDAGIWAPPPGLFDDIET